MFILINLLYYFSVLSGEARSGGAQKQRADGRVDSMSTSLYTHCPITPHHPLPIPAISRPQRDPILTLPHVEIASGTPPPALPCPAQPPSPALLINPAPLTNSILPDIVQKTKGTPLLQKKRNVFDSFETSQSGCGFL